MTIIIDMHFMKMILCLIILVSGLICIISFSNLQCKEDFNFLNLSKYFTTFIFITFGMAHLIFDLWN